MLFERLVTGEKEDRHTAETKASDYNEKTNKHFNMFQLPCINPYPTNVENRVRS